MITTFTRWLFVTVVLASLVPAQGSGHSLIRVPEQTKEEVAVRQTKVRSTLDRVGPAVVHVMVRVSGIFRFEGDSSGVVIDPSGLVLTNWHLVQKASKQGKGRVPMVRTADGKEYPAPIVASSFDCDLALLKAELPDGVKLPYVQFGDSKNILPGETLLVVGRPNEEIYGTFIGSANPAQGGIRFEKKHENNEEPEYIDVKREDILLSDANFKMFTDGGPVFDINGRLLAIVNTSKVRPPLGKDATDEEKRKHRNSFGFAMRLHVAQRVFEKSLSKIETTAALPSEEKARRSGIAPAVAKASPAIVSVRQASVKEMPKADILDPYGKFPGDTYGSGVLVDPSGLVLTNAFIAGRSDVLVTTQSGKVYKGKVVATRVSKNVALVELDVPEGTVLPFLKLADSAASVIGERVAALGNRYGHTVSVRMGVLSSKSRTQDVGSQHTKSMGHFQTDANINNGNTGGALINLDGQLLGLADVRAAIEKLETKERHEAKAAITDTTIGFAVPSDWIREQLRDDIVKVAEKSPLLSKPDAASAGESQITRIVAKHADCFLNVFVKKEKAGKPKGGLMDDLFPEPADDKDFHLLGQGSGVIIDPTGLALTNWHVVDAATYKDGSARKDHKVFVSLGNGKKYGVEILSTSRIDDLALLQLTLEPGEKLSAIRLGDSDSLKVGETVIAVGNPHGFANSVTVGLVSAKNRDIMIAGRARKFSGLIQTDAAINPGNSGGALIDLNGFLVGINNAGNKIEAKQGFAIPVNYVRKKFHQTLLSSDKLRSVFLGMRTEDRVSRGVFVKDVEEIGPAKDAGVEEGDRIVKAQGQAINSTLQFVKIASAVEPFRPFPIEIRREGKKMDLVIEPVSDAAWAIFRRANFAVKEVDWEQAGAKLKDAGIAAYREFAGDSNAIPTEQKTVGLIVTHTLPSAVTDGMDMKKGDVIIGLRALVREIHLPDRFVLEHINTLKYMLDYIRQKANKDGAEIELWTVRDGKVIKAKVVVKKPVVK